MSVERNEAEKIPLISFFFKPSPYLKDFILEDESSSENYWDDNLCVMIGRDGIPVFASRTKRPPTSCTTPAKTLPSGYTRSGKWKPSKHVPAKTDKRAGK